MDLLIKKKPNTVLDATQNNSFNKLLNSDITYIPKSIHIMNVYLKNFHKVNTLTKLWIPIKKLKTLEAGLLYHPIN